MIVESGYHNCHPCAGCGDEGEQVWLGAESNLCFECRRKPNMTMVLRTQDLPSPKTAQEQARGFLQQLEEYVGPDAACFTIDTQEDLECASESLQEIKAIAKRLEEGEKSMTAPILQGVNRIRDFFRPARTLATKAEGLWKGKILESNRRREEAARLAAAQVQEAVAKGDTRAALVAHSQIQPVERVQGLQIRKRWVATVINQGLLPAEYLVPNQAAIDAEMRAQIARNDVPVIPGVKFEQVEVVASR